MEGEKDEKGGDEGNAVADVTIDVEAALGEIDEALGEDIVGKPAGDETVDEPAGDEDENPDKGKGKPPAGEVPATGAAPAPASGTPPAGGEPAKPPIPSALPNGLPQAFRTWRPEAQAVLLELQKNSDPAFQAKFKAVYEEALKREEDIDKGISQYKESAQFAEVFRKVLNPYIPLFQHHRMDPLKEVGSLLQMRAALALGTPQQKIALLRQIAKGAQVPFEELGRPDEPLDPTVAALRSELDEIRSTTSQELEALKAEKNNALRTELEAFARDPANRYFDRVAPKIPGLIKAGLAKGYKDAYDMAVRLDPVVQEEERQRLAAESAEAARKKAAEDAAATAKAKAANVRTSAKNRSPAAPVGSIEDTLNETMAGIKARTS